MTELDFYTGSPILGEQETAEPIGALRVLNLIFQMAAHLSFPAGSLTQETSSLLCLCDLLFLLRSKN